MFGDDDFELNEDELAAEHAMSIADENKVKVLENIKLKIDEAIKNLEYSETTEFQTNFEIIARYVSVVFDINAMQNDPDVSEEELLEAIESIEITVKELSFRDLKELEKQESITMNGDDSDEDDQDSSPFNLGDDFGF